LLDLGGTRVKALLQRVEAKDWRDLRITPPALRSTRLD
jgi:hypothetical protein